jgi:hypothetical protein
MMNSKYIKLKMTPTSSGIGGSFIARASFKLDSIRAPFSNVIVKIDTGCSVSTIPLGKYSNIDTESLKRQDIVNNILACPIELLNSEYFDELKKLTN